MICACQTQDFVPFGRKYVQKHPGPFQLQVQNVIHADHGLPLLKSFRNISIQDDKKVKEQWLFFDNKTCKPGEFDEELYACGNTVVWSKGGQDGTRTVVKTFTMDSPVLQVIRCRFIRPGVEETEDCGTISESKYQDGICVIESGSLSCFMDNGVEYLAALPFQVARAWVINNGLLFERITSPAETAIPKKNSPNQTTVFSLLHPLEEVAPVITKTGICPKISYLTDNTQHIIFSSRDPSLVLTYDSMVGVHSIWKVRRARQEECNQVCSTGWDNTASLCQIGSGTPAGLNQSSSMGFSRLLTSNISAHSTSISPMRSYSSRLGSPAAAFLSRSSQSPLITDRRSQSPAFPAGSIYRFHSPSPQTVHTLGNYTRTPPVGINNLSLINDSYSEWIEPITPDICFEHVWTEPAPAIRNSRQVFARLRGGAGIEFVKGHNLLAISQPSCHYINTHLRDGSLGRSSKAFLTKDMCGQQFLCYMISYRQQLRCLKFEESNDLSQLIFGAVAVIPAKDALPVENLDLMVVLDTSCSLFVYSGTTKINRLHVPTLPLGGSASLSMLRAVTPINSPSRGGVVTSSRPPSAMDARFDEEFQLNQISPVPTELEDTGHFDDFPPGSSLVTGLRDNVGTSFTVELVNGHMFRSSLPSLTSSPGISLCLKAMKHLLPKDLALTVLGKWYTVRNIQAGLGGQSEWALFTRCMLGLMGYDTSRLALTSKHEVDTSMSPVMSAKKPRPSDQGSEEDWEAMLGSDHHTYVCDSVQFALRLSPCLLIPDSTHYSRPCCINTLATLFPHIPAVFMALHLVYEELKLNTLLVEEMEMLVPLLYHLARDLKMLMYMDYYYRDFPKVYNTVDDISQVTEDDLEKLQYPSVFSRNVPSVNQWILDSLEGQETGPLYYIPNVTTLIKNVVSLYALLLNKNLSTERAIDKCLRKLAPAGHRGPTCDTSSLSYSFMRASPTVSSLERIVLYMTELGVTKKELTYLPVGVSLPLMETIFHCRCNPPLDWPEEAYLLIGRQDISRLVAMQKEKTEAEDIPAVTERRSVGDKPGGTKRNTSHQGKANKEDEDGMEHVEDEVLRLRFSEDLRVQEARRLLQSSRPARIALEQRPEVSDHDFIEEQERYLYSICIRTMALPVGRGIFTLSTYHPLPTEALPIPRLCLTGRAPPRNATVDLSHIDTPANMSAWPHFHNGVAAGLRIAHSSQVNSTWIIYNKPRSNELTNEYAGFLMALGLNRHLVNLHTLNVHDYLSKGHEMTTVGLLLGLAAAKRGSMDLATMKVLSIHVPALLPPTSTELSVPHNVQVAAVLGVGLLYQGTGHRHTAEVLLSEIGRPPGPEMENCTDRESYSLASGLALGLVMFGKGGTAVGTSDMSMADTLCHFMVGGHKRPMTGSGRERYKTPSYQIKEGNSVNVDVTSPGATLALAMLYFNTGNSAVAEWLKVPDSQIMLDHIRPDFLMLRSLARGLVMWDDVLPSFSYIQKNIPQILCDHAFRKGEETNEDSSIDYETMSQAYCNVVAGASMVIGLKFAGTANQAAFDTLMECMKRSLRIISSPYLVEQAGKSTVENCMITVLLSMAMVMAGTGNLEVLRICRMFRSRVGPPYNLYVMYGSHMAISMAIGLLFLGGGRYSLSSSPESIAVLLCAFFPKFPMHSNDNRYHLQAFRHLYVLAAEARVVLPRDVDTGHACYVPLQIKFKDCKHYQHVSYKTAGPCVLPDLDLLEEVTVLGPRYWPIVFHVDKNWHTLKLLLQHSGTLYVKQRDGHLSYLEDPKGYRSMLAKSLTTDQSTQGCTVKPDVIKAFTSDPKVLSLTDYFLDNGSQLQGDLLQMLSALIYQCVTLEKPDAISTHISLDQVLRRCDTAAVLSLGISQLKLVLAYYMYVNKTPLPMNCGQTKEARRQLMKPEFLLALKNKLELTFDNWQSENTEVLLQYLKGESLKGSTETDILAAFLTWFDIPSPTEMSTVALQDLSIQVLHQKKPQLRSTRTLIRALSGWRNGQSAQEH